ncbi:hypothetical protein EK21DRAFT_93434 [Setomelanomma holmii]|uniref:Uncharacterized protein n=1 Tax=Setomelanomma holmii TaxID=210430 RepID=A0A9P4GYI6_9PLEO|nr:hypothetical protein EK21DRAFT_93434 [Setomelanomma holmii]
MCVKELKTRKGGVRVLTGKGVEGMSSLVLHYRDITCRRRALTLLEHNGKDLNRKCLPIDLAGHGGGSRCSTSDKRIKSDVMSNVAASSSTSFLRTAHTISFQFRMRPATPARDPHTLNGATQRPYGIIVYLHLHVAAESSEYFCLDNCCSRSRFALCCARGIGRYTCADRICRPFIDGQVVEEVVVVDLFADLNGQAKER